MAKLFHVSDVHFGKEDKAAIAWFAERVEVERPDAVIMTGDLTMRARRREFEAGGAWLKSLPAPVTVEIGNHDIPYYWDPIRRFLSPYRRYAAIERMIERPLELPGVTIVPLKTIARAQWRMNWSKGYVGRDSLDRALRLCAAAPKGNLIFVAAHHPLIEAGTKGTARTFRGEEALVELAAAGAHAVLSGHVHDPFDIPVERSGRMIRMIGAGTLSVRTRNSPPGFNEIRVHGDQFETLARTQGPEPKHPLSKTVETSARPGDGAAAGPARA